MYENIESIIEKLDEHDKIFFGPFVGSYKYEIFYWSGFVRWYINNNPDKKYIICTRKNRKGLYDFDLKFEFIHILDELHSDSFGYNFKYSSIKHLVDYYKDKYSDYFIFNTEDINNDNLIFIDSDYYDYNILTSESDQNIIKKIISKHDKLIPICVFPKIDPETKHYQCWNPDNWNFLLDGLSSTTKYLIFNIGCGDNYFKSFNKQYVYNLENYYSDVLNTSISGLTIEAIRNSKLSIGTTNANIVLSMILEKDCIIWGHENHEFVEEFNLGSKITGFSSRSYNLNPYVVFEEVQNNLKKIKF